MSGSLKRSRRSRASVTRRQSSAKYGYGCLCQVAHIQGFGRITGPNEVVVDKVDGTKEQVPTKNILIATGSEVMPFPGIDVS